MSCRPSAGHAYPETPASALKLGALHGRAPFLDAALPKVDPRDVAASAVAALTDQNADQATYVITGPDSITTREEVAIVAALLGREPALASAFGTWNSNNGCVLEGWRRTSR